MSSTTTTYTSRSDSASTGLPSKAILLFAVLAAILLSALDINFHGHWSCGALQEQVLAKLNTQTHLQSFLVDQEYDTGAKDAGGQPILRKEEGKVTCECKDGNKIVLKGKVLNNQIRQQFSDIAALAVGTNRVDNQLEVLNEPELGELQNLLKASGVTMNYQLIGERGLVQLTGDLPNPAMKDQITALVQKIHGVRGVINNMGKELQVQRMLRIYKIWFDFNEWKIRPLSADRSARNVETHATLDEIAQSVEDYLADHPQGKVRIEGHTDAIASNDYNNWLSQKRADSVLEALTARGIPRERLQAEGKGEGHPVASNDTPEGRSENRRIEFYFE